MKPIDAKLAKLANKAHAEIKATERPQGKWIFTEYMVWQCSNCGGNPHAGTGFVPDTESMKRQWKYCNLCGADMRGGAEDV